MAEERARGLGKIELLVIIVIVSLGMAALVSIIVSDQEISKKKDCISNLKCIGVGVSMYKDKFGSYPQGESGQFFENLRHGMPDACQDGLFVCPAKGGRPGPGVCQYRGPAVELMKGLPWNTIIGCDFPDNHGPQEDVNVLYFDGHVDVAWYGSTGWRQADKETR